MRINPAAAYVAFFINSFRGQDFKAIPYASIRIFEGSAARVNEVFATYNVANDASFAGSVSMVLGVLYKRNNEWKFNAIGMPTKDKTLEETQQTIQQNYL